MMNLRYISLILLFSLPVLRAEIYLGRAFSCTEMMYEHTDQTMKDWFLSESEALLKKNPHYDSNAMFETPTVKTQSIHCGTKAREHIAAIRQAVNENRKNIHTPDYLPKNISAMIDNAKKELGLVEGYVFKSEKQMRKIDEM